MASYRRWLLVLFALILSGGQLIAAGTKEQRAYAAAVTAFLGKKVRIRSAKTLQSPYEIVNPWSQQGRVFVQASHNLRSR